MVRLVVVVIHNMAPAPSGWAHGTLVREENRNPHTSIRKKSSEPGKKGWDCACRLHLHTCMPSVLVQMGVSEGLRLLT